VPHSERETATKMRIMIKRIFGLTLIALLTACQNGNNGTQENYSIGNLQDSIYTNEYFNINLTIPNGWYVYPREYYDAFSKKGKEYNQTNEPVEESDNVLLNLLIFSDKSIADSTFARQTIMLNAEKPINNTEYSSELDFLERTKQEMIRYQLPMKFSDKIDTIKISGMDFFVFHTEFQTEKGIIYQEYMTRREKDFYLNIALSYYDSTQRNDLINFLNENMK
jgi:hypothetical protein